MPDIKFPTYSTQKPGKKKQAKVVDPKGMRMVDTQPAARRHQKNQHVRLSCQLVTLPCQGAVSQLPFLYTCAAF